MCAAAKAARELPCGMGKKNEKKNKRDSFADLSAEDLLARLMFALAAPEVERPGHERVETLDCIKHTLNVEGLRNRRPSD